MSAYAQAVHRHYADVWSAPLTSVPLAHGPVYQISADFAVLRTPPRPERPCWTYCTQGMSGPDQEHPLELHIFSSVRADGLAELLAATAHFHRTGHELGLHHTVNFGLPWIAGSSLDHGFLSLPYLDGPGLEWLDFLKKRIRFLWLIPISAAERDFKRLHGVTALEDRMEQNNFAYADPFRRLLV